MMNLCVSIFFRSTIFLANNLIWNCMSLDKVASRDKNRPWWLDGIEWKDHRSINKNYSRDHNKMIFAKIFNRLEGLVPRCRLFSTWGRREVCSPLCHKSQFVTVKI